MIAETYNCGTGKGLEYGFWFKEHKHSPDRIFHICLGLATNEELNKGEDKIEEDFEEFRPLMNQMAAAPEMLAAMEEAINIADRWWEENTSACDCIEAMQLVLKEAIAKAKGEI